MKSWWTWWGLKTLASRLFAQMFVKLQIKENIKAPRYFPLWWESIRWLVDSLHKWPVTWTMFITRNSEVIMFSPCVFVYLCVCVYVCHDVCPDDLTMKDWCHTNNILQVHCWRCLVVQVMFHALMTSFMTEMLMAIFLVYSTSGITSGEKVCRELKMAAIF